MLRAARESGTQVIWDLFHYGWPEELDILPEFVQRFRAFALDIIGINYYNHNQWLHNGAFLEMDDPIYRPFSEILLEVYNRYGHPLFVTETGIEGTLPYMSTSCTAIKVT